MNRIKSGDMVVVTAGKSKGHVGKVLRMVLKKDRLVVEGANLVKKHVKPVPQKQQEGGIVTREAALHISNVALYNQVTKKADKVGFKFIEINGVKQKVRFYKSTNELVDVV